MAHKSGYITDFDSSSSMLFALGHFLHQKPFIGCGIAPALPDFTAKLIRAIPKKIRRDIYGWSGKVGAVSVKKARRVNSEEISGWIIKQYPAGKKYPAVTIGSSNGAIMHLCAALGIPWLPQTALLSVRRQLHPDDVRGDAEWGKRVVKEFLPSNPDLAAYQAHDPLQDRLMIREMGYFRLKRLKLGRLLEEFIRNSVEPGGTVFSIECNYAWPVYRLGERHTFQIGGLGGLEPQEYLQGNAKIDEFLSHYKTTARCWNLEGAALSRPEAEWGFDEELYHDTMRFCHRYGFRLERIRFDHPEALTPFVADLYRAWYAKMGWETNRLFAECFAMVEPLWTFKSGAIPFWMAFNTTCSSELLDQYLKKHPELEEVFVMLMSNGVDNAIGLTPIARWKEIIRQTRKGGDFLGVDEKQYPVDFGSFVIYHSEIRRKMGQRHQLPPPLTLDELHEFLKNNPFSEHVTWHIEKNDS